MPICKTCEGRGEVQEITGTGQHTDFETCPDCCGTGYTIRTSVYEFITAMERELSANDHKPGWKDTDKQILHRRMIGNITELTYAIQSRDAERIKKTCADIANYAMMIWDVTK